jgi:hypothetical protein
LHDFDSILDMHQDDLKTVWICNECGMSFIFFSDMQDHKAKFGHVGIKKYDLSSGKLLESIAYDKE